jgi:tRNA(Ile)-lysidine synthase
VRAAEALSAVEPGGPLSDHELVTLFAPLAQARQIALAVSGGADSLALLDAADRWRKARGRPEVVVLTVDHRLQPGSGAAAAQVKEIAAARGLTTEVLIRKGNAPESNIEAEARRARYRLLFDACRRIGASHLVTAHHRDDVAETFLMRLKRGAGIFGLAAMRPAVDVGGVMLVRPFLSVSRARLAATTAAAGWMPFDDPMNADPRFARTAARRLLAAGGLDAAVVAAVASRIAELADAVDAAATALVAEAVASDEYAIAWLDARRFADTADEVRARVLVRLLIAVGGDDYPPRSERLSGLLSAMLSTPAAGRLKRTLSGVVVERRGGRFAFYREAGRGGPRTVTAAPGQSVIWDHRFAVTLDAGSPEGLTVGPLGEVGRRVVGATTGKLADPALPAAAMAVLPALRQGSEILAVPVFRADRTQVAVVFTSLLPKRLSRPPLFPDFSSM